MSTLSSGLSPQSASPSAFHDPSRAGVVLVGGKRDGVEPAAIAGARLGASHGNDRVIAAEQDGAGTRASGGAPRARRERARRRHAPARAGGSIRWSTRRRRGHGPDGRRPAPRTRRAARGWSRSRTESSRDRRVRCSSPDRPRPDRWGSCWPPAARSRGADRTSARIMSQAMDAHEFLPWTGSARACRRIHHG